MNLVKYFSKEMDIEALTCVHKPPYDTIRYYQRRFLAGKKIKKTQLTKLTKKEEKLKRPLLLLFFRNNARSALD